MQFIIYVHLTKIHNKNLNILKKYNRKYLFAMFDVLYSKNEF